MKKRLLVLHIFLFLISILSPPKDSFSQSVGIGTTTPNASAVLDITTTNKGLLIPRMSTAAVLSIPNPARGLMVYDSLSNQLMANIGTPAAPNWQTVVSNSSVWKLTGNSGINPANQFIGNTDNQPLRFRINNIKAGELHPVTGNIFWGKNAGQANATGFSNIGIGTSALKLNIAGSNLVAIGDSALFNSLGDLNSGDASFNTAIGSKSLFTNTTGSKNTATGFNSLFSNTTGGFNTATGYQSLFANTTGNSNTAAGFNSLSSNTTGNSNTAFGSLSLFINTTGNINTAIGDQSLSRNTTGNSNTAIGSSSLFSNTAGSRNIATGTSSLFSNTTGNNNSAIGFESLLFNTTGNDNTAIGNESLFANTADANTAIGSQSLKSNTTGNNNTAVGSSSLFSNTIGASNIAIGTKALFSNSRGDRNVAIGDGTLSNTISSSDNTVVGFHLFGGFNIGNSNTLIGFDAETVDGLDNCVALGSFARCTADDQVRLGNGNTSSIGGFVGFSNFSDGRYKKNIREAVKGIDFIMKLRPVTYQLDIAGLNRKLNINGGSKMDDPSKKGVNENEKTIFSGFVAQEVEQAAKDAGYDFSGVDKPKNENDMYGLRYAEFVVPLVKAMQEQQQLIDELRKQNADLQKRVLALEKK